MEDRRPHLLAVDDNPENLDVLIGLLEDDYKISVATSGARALELAFRTRPDLILLDIMMPEMDGLELCRRLKERDELGDVPVIFISALERVDEKVKAFTYGGVDYVTKPFQPEELRARISTHLTLQRMQRELANQNAHLDELVRRKSRELAEAHDRLALANATKQDFLKLISHELRTPANGILGIADLMFESCGDSDEASELRPLFDASRDRMVETLDNALLLAQVHVSKEDFHVSPLSLQRLLTEAHRSASAAAQEAGVRFHTPPESAAQVIGDEDMLQTALTSLLQTAAAFTDPGTRVAIRVEETTEHIAVTLMAQGHPLDAADAANFFEVFSDVRSRTAAEPLGLKPAVAERIISLYGGKVQLAAPAEGGTEIRIALKKADAGAAVAD